MIARLIGGDGKPVFVDLPEGAALPEGAIAVDRKPQARGEDFVGGHWVRDDREAADHAAGPRHIAEARALKYLEALLIDAGIELRSGMLAEEAKAKKLPQRQLAQLVIARRQPFISRELARQAGQERATPAKKSED